MAGPWAGHAGDRGEPQKRLLVPPGPAWAERGWRAEGPEAPHLISSCRRRSSPRRCLLSCRCFLSLSSRSFRTLVLGLSAIGRSGFTFFWEDRGPSVRRECWGCHLPSGLFFIF